MADFEYTTETRPKPIVITATGILEEGQTLSDLDAVSDALSKTIPAGKRARVLARIMIHIEEQA
jgi:hypothetical protein